MNESIRETKFSDIFNWRFSILAVSFHQERRVRRSSKLQANNRRRVDALSLTIPNIDCEWPPKRVEVQTRCNYLLERPRRNELSTRTKRKNENIYKKELTFQYRVHSLSVERVPHPDEEELLGPLG